MQSLRGRLNRLERAILPSGGCPACRDRRGRVVVHTCRQMADGSMRPDGDAPQPCDVCGEAPEEVIEIVEVVVSTRAESVRWPAGHSKRIRGDAMRNLRGRLHRLERSAGVASGRCPNFPVA